MLSKDHDSGVVYCDVPYLSNCLAESRHVRTLGQACMRRCDNDDARNHIVDFGPHVDRAGVLRYGSHQERN
jgi:hypothetical protein